MTTLRTMSAVDDARAALEAALSDLDSSLNVTERIAASDAASKAASELLSAIVAEAREDGTTWKQVGEALGIHFTSAQQRFTKK